MRSSLRRADRTARRGGSVLRSATSPLWYLKFDASRGKRSSAIVVLNKVETIPFELDERSLKQRYPFIRAFVGTDCEGDEPPCIEAFRRTIHAETDGVPGRFISYAHADERYLKNLQDHLAVLKRQRLVSVWYDREIDGGDEWDEEIRKQLFAADIILLIVSPAFLASEYIDSEELSVALALGKARKTTVIPVILEDSFWKDNKALASFQALPKGATPIRDWQPQRRGWLDAAKGIQRVAKKIVQKRAKAEAA